MSGNNFYALVVGWLVGIALGTSDLVSYSETPFIVICSIVFLLFTAYFVRSARMSVVFLSALCMFGFWHATSAVQKFDDLARFTEAAERKATVIHVVKSNTSKTQIILHDHIWDVGVRAYLDGDVPNVGDIIQYYASLREPEAFVTETGRVFAYAEYSRARNVLFEAHNFTSEVIGVSRYYSLVRRLYEFRDDIAAVIERAVSPPEAGLAQAMLLGIGGTLDEDENRVFREVGLVHIVVLSGFHIMAIFGTMVVLIGYFLPYRTRFIVALLTTILFSIMVGLTPTVIRAVIMASCVALAFVLGKGRAPMRALAIAAFIITFLSPYALLYDTGFQFSFMATFAIVVVVPVVMLFLRAVPTTFELRSIVAATISVEMILTPLLSWSMGTFPVIGTLANVLVLPVVPFAMLASLFLWIGSLTMPSALPFLANIVTILHGYIIAVAHVMHALPYAHIKIASFSLSVLGMMYMVVGVFILWLAYRRYGMPQKQQSAHHEPNVDDWTIESIGSIRARLIKKAPEGALGGVVVREDAS